MTNQVRDNIFPIDAGIDPVNEFESKSMITNLVSKPNSEGKRPVSLLVPKFINVRADNLPIVLGKLPLKLLQHNPKEARADMLPMLDGRLPTKFCMFCKTTLTTRGTPSTVAHVTLCHAPLQGSYGLVSHQLLKPFLTAAGC